MKRKKKMSLTELKVESFMTEVDKDEKTRAIGAQAAASGTANADFCCGVASALDPQFCSKRTVGAYCI